ncbi:unnamed protein product [Protopolystoma xenopodis]|uniref:Uncharacterized protein n=1 Tax=Protopolystoma xenopodis TaxID=117903 RepID=A0A3S5A8N0_9PLAT|nr:unnamed protein product [Protopolystoma xenopodis]
MDGRRNVDRQEEDTATQTEAVPTRQPVRGLTTDTTTRDHFARQSCPRIGLERLSEGAEQTSSSRVQAVDSAGHCASASATDSSGGTRTVDEHEHVCVCVCVLLLLLTPGGGEVKRATVETNQTGSVLPTASELCSLMFQRTTNRLDSMHEVMEKIFLPALKVKPAQLGKLPLEKYIDYVNSVESYLIALESKLESCFVVMLGIITSEAGELIGPSREGQPDPGIPDATLDDSFRPNLLEFR